MKVIKEVKLGMQGFFAGAVARPVALLVIFVTLIVVGIISYRRIPLQLMPSNFSEPSINIFISNPGSTARENEEFIAQPVEEQLRTLIGIESTDSYSDEGNVQFRVDFQSHVDMDLARAEVRDRLERARPSMPSTAEAAGMWSESASSLPLSFFVISVAGDPLRRDYLIDKVIKPRLEAVQGIGRVDVWGTQDDSVRILLDEDKVIASQLNIGQIITRLSQDNFALPLGEVKDGGREIIMRSDMRFSSLEEIANFPITEDLRLKDIAVVSNVKESTSQSAIMNGSHAFYGMATKDSQANVVACSNAFKEALKSFENDLATGGDVSVTPIFIQGDIIEGAMDQMKNTAVWGGLLAVVVLFVFLRRVRLTLCVAASIPVSALLAITHAYFTGSSFNLLTMTGITLATGMLVDNAVVVVENIVRLRASGEHRLSAAAYGTRQIMLAVTCATLTTIVVFMPLIFMTENPMMRVIMGNLGIPLSMSLFASLVIATIFLPVIAARILGKESAELGRLERIFNAVSRVPVRGIAYLAGAARYGWHIMLQVLHATNMLATVTLYYARWVLVPALVWVITVTAASMAGQAEAGEFTRSLKEFGLKLSMDPKSFQGGVIVFALVAILIMVFPINILNRHRKQFSAPARPSALVPVGNSLVDMLIQINQALVSWALKHRLMACGVAILCFATISIPIGITALGSSGGGDRDNDADFRVVFEADFTKEEAETEVMRYADFMEAKQLELDSERWIARFDETGAQFQIYFKRDLPNNAVTAIESDLKDELPSFPGHRLVFYEENASSSKTDAVARFQMTGPDSRELERLGALAQEILERVPGLEQVTSPLARAPEMVEVKVDRELAMGMGVTSQSIQNSISWTLGGFPLSRYHDEGREVPLLIEFDGTESAGLSSLRDLAVNGDEGAVPLSTFAEMSFTRASRRIYRHNGQTSFTIEAQVADPLKVIGITEGAYRALDQLELPRGFAWDRSESALNRTQDEMGELYRALAFALLLVFLLMAFLFESLALPFSVLFSVPFAILGAQWILLITGTPFDFLGIIGYIILAGVVVNNGIVLVDRIHILRGSMTRSEAVLLGCKQRVRPVLMTALTTISGLLPMAITEPASQSVFDYRSLAMIVAGGLAVSTFFTLWVVPLAYTLLDDLRNFAMGWAGWVLRPLRTKIQRAGSEAMEQDTDADDQDLTPGLAG
jgi:multidrug efflux pump subunit AcrB